jgi:hypothetical protein
LKEKISKFEQRFKGINNLQKFTSQDIVNLLEKEIFSQ